MKGNRLKGARKVKRLLKRLPESVSAEIVEIYRAEAPAIEAYMRAAAPRKSGKLSSALSVKILPKSLRMRAGIIGKRLNRELFYAKILELGRGVKRQYTRMFSRSLPGGGRTRRYQYRIPVIAKGRFDFVYGRAAKFSFDRLRPQLKNVWEKALLRAASGGGNGE